MLEQSTALLKEAKKKPKSVEAEIEAKNISNFEADVKEYYCITKEKM